MTITTPSDQGVRMERGLRMLTVAFPYLAGLAAATRVTMDDRVPTMGVFASGRLIANAQWVARLNEADLQFVLAHEMLHLALRTHDRARGADHKEFNIAHDYIINDLLRKALQRDHIPAGGLDMPGASTRSAEEIVLELRRNAANQHPTQQGVWDGDDQGDVLSDDQERTLYPGEAKEQAERAERIKAAAVKSLGLAQAVGALGHGRGSAAGAHSETITALRGLYRTPWQQVLQRWLKSIAPAERSFHRPSRRAQAIADTAGDVVLPGRRRAGWLLNVILDTSESMTDELPRALGAIADFCDAMAVDQVRLVQCDAALASDTLIDPSSLAHVRASGFGGSDFTPAFEHLAHDPRVRAVLVITDGDITIPAVTPMFDVLWLITSGHGGFGSSSFHPPFGRVVKMERT